MLFVEVFVNVLGPPQPSTMKLSWGSFSYPAKFDWFYIKSVCI